MAIEWITGYCEYDSNEQPAGNVKVTDLHWTCTASDSGESVSLVGSVNAAQQDRVYTLASLQNVPQHVMTNWVHQAMGAEDVAAVEANAAAQLEEKLNPTSGGFVPSA